MEAVIDCNPHSQPKGIVVMKLYFSPYTCSLAPHILLCETRTPYSLERVDLKTRTTSSGADYYAIHSRGQVPLLVLPTGEQLSEGPIISQFIAENASAEDLLPARGLPRYRVLEWQNYISSEIHKSFSPLFNAAFSAEAKQTVRTLLRKKYEWLNGQLGADNFLTGSVFTIADAYLFVVSQWAKVVGLDISDLNNVQQYLSRIAERQSVKEAIKAEADLNAAVA
jgi:glutathione S-transferase